MHIVIVNRWYPPASGGIAAYNRNLCRELVKQGQRVTVIAARWDSQSPSLEVLDGVSVHRLRHPYRSWFRRLPLMGRHMRVVCQMLYSLQATRKLRKLEKKDPPDAVEFADVEAEGFAYLLRKRRSPVVVRCHTPMFVLRHYYGPEEMPFCTSLISRLEKFCIRHADVVTTPSRDTAERMALECGIPARKITVIPNPIEIESSKSAPRPEASGKSHADVTQPCVSAAKEFTVAHVGRLERAKGIEVLARAVPMVLARIPSARFVFIGGAKDIPFWRHRLESLLGEHENSGKILLLGAVDEECLAGWYHRADVAVVASQLYESFSYTCAQAMAAGVPVVASRIGGIPETLEYGTCGMLVEPGDSEALARAIIHLAENPQLRQRMGRAGRARAETVFAASRVAQETLRLYSSFAAAERASKR